MGSTSVVDEIIDLPDFILQCLKLIVLRWGRRRLGSTPCSKDTEDEKGNNTNHQ